MRIVNKVGLLSCVLALGCCVGLSAAESTKASSVKNRMLVLSDIEADPDDSQTLIRLLLYVNQIDLEGMVATTSVHQKNMVAPQTMHKIIDAYAKVRDNLNKHEAGFPAAKALHALVKQALPVYGMSGVGEDKDSEGSDWLIKAIERKDERPLWITVWGGTNTLAQALFRLKQTKDPQKLAELLNKLRVYSISDQDDSGTWIRSTFPSLFYIVSPGGYGAATWTGINTFIDGLDNTTISNQWIADNIQQGHGPLGAEYPDVAYGVEGDTPSWLNLISNGLNQPEHPEWGGWGGRYELRIPNLADMDPNGFNGGVPIKLESRAIWTNAVDNYMPPERGAYGRALKPGTKSFVDYRATLYRWRDEFQNDFAARMDWTTKSYNQANHAPIPVLNHSNHLKIKSGEYLHLDARSSYDPDGDSLQFYWFNYPEAGTLPNKLIKIETAENMNRAGLHVPKVTKSETLQIILKVTDRGIPALTRYQRVFVTVTP
ncbi:MAG: DUF1593 domain-containing protein [Paraglaciecola sp.]|nr:DUF1593 domain-containing protein [Paraglaciecola sp.]NCT48256.1 DUF1593 domain-containing protein [Paraglaciecola sp.]